MKQQTAVEQLSIALYEGGYLKGNGDEIQKLVNKAKEMEKEHMLAIASYFYHERGNLTPTKYYKETYGGNK